MTMSAEEVGAVAAEGGPSTSFTSGDDFIAFDFGDDDAAATKKEAHDDEEKRTNIRIKGSASTKPSASAASASSSKEKRGKEKRGNALQGRIGGVNGSTAGIASTDDKERSSKRKKDRSATHSPEQTPLLTEHNAEGSKRQKTDAQSDKGKAPMSAQQRKRERRENTFTAPWCDEVDFERCSNAAEMLHDELIAFAHWISPTKIEHDARQAVVQLIRRCIATEWPDARIEAFGSQNTQLYLPQGDIDLVVMSEEMETQRKETVLRKMAAILRRNNLATDVQVIARAKVPIVKFICTLGKLKVDVSINQDNGIAACDFVREWLDQCPALRPLIMATKLLLSKRGLSEVFSGGLGSYSVICLVISHIQMHPKVQRGEVDPSLNLGVLFLDFLELFGKNFGYDNVGVSVTGRGRYFTKISRGWRDDRRPFMLSIEDPLDETNDISKGSFAIISVRQALGGAFDILTAALCQRATERARRRAADHWLDGDDDDKQVRKRAKADEDEEARAAILNEINMSAAGADETDPHSLLGAVLGVSRDVLKARRELEDLWQKGTLQNRIGRTPSTRTPEPLGAFAGQATKEKRKNKEVHSKEQRKAAYTEKKKSDKTAVAASVTKAQTTQTNSALASGLRGSPLVIEDSSSSAKHLSYDSDFAVSEMQRAGVIDVDNSDSEETGAPFNWANTNDDEQRDTRYADSARRKDVLPNGSRTSKSSRRHGDAFSTKPQNQPFVDDASGSESEGNANEGELQGKIPSASASGKSSRSGSVEARRKRKADYWASKANTTASTDSSSDEDFAGKTSEGGRNHDDDEVMLNVYG